MLNHYNDFFWGRNLTTFQLFLADEPGQNIYGFLILIEFEQLSPAKLRVEGGRRKR